MIKFFTDNYIEIFAAILGFLFIYLEIKENKWLWLVGIISPCLYIYVFYSEKLYAAMSLQFYFCAISIYGWISWTRNIGNDESDTLKIQRLSKKNGFVLIFFIISLFLLVSFILVNYTDSAYPYLDALASSLGMAASWMLTQKILEQWLVWFVADFISVGLYLYKGLYPTSVLIIAYMVFAVVGFHKWKSSFKESLL